MQRIVSVRCCLGAMLLLLIASCLSADNSPERNAGPDPKKNLQPGDIDVQASRVYAFVDKTGFGHQHAVVGRIKSGSVKLAERMAGRIEFDMTSFAADPQEARRYLRLPGQTDGNTQRQVTQNMLSEAVLDITQFPTASFVVESMKEVRKAGGGAKAQFELAGVFTLHGVSQKLTVKAEGSEERGYLRLTGSFPIRQTSFGITPYTKALGAVGVADAVRIYGVLWIVAEPAVPPAEEKPVLGKKASVR